MMELTILSLSSDIKVNCMQLEASVHSKTFWIKINRINRYKMLFALMIN